jgi:uncharacterized protein (TIGR02246 family)
MRMPATRIGLAALLVMAAACRPTPEDSASPATGAAGAATFSAADEAAVRAVDSAFAAASRAGDGAAVGALYASDATLMPPGDSSRHGAGITTYWSGVFSAYSFPVSLTSVSVEGSGDLAISTGTYRVVMTPKAAGARPLPLDNGKYLGVLKRQADGSWKYIYDTWNSDTPPTP